MDLRNRRFSFSHDPTFGAGIEFRDGRHQAANSPEDYEWIDEIAYGDLTGDGRDEAIILSRQHTAGTGRFSTAIIFELDDRGVVSQLATVEGGDRANGGIVDIEVESGRLHVTRNVEWHSGACCPAYQAKTTYSWFGKALVETQVSRSEVAVVGKTISIPPSEVRMLDVRIPYPGTLDLSVKVSRGGKVTSYLIPSDQLNAYKKANRRLFGGKFQHLAPFHVLETRTFAQRSQIPEGEYLLMLENRQLGILSNSSLDVQIAAVLREE